MAMEHRNLTAVLLAMCLVACNCHDYSRNVKNIYVTDGIIETPEQARGEGGRKQVTVHELVETPPVRRQGLEVPIGQKSLEEETRFQRQERQEEAPRFQRHLGIDEATTLQRHLGIEEAPRYQRHLGIDEAPRYQRHLGLEESPGFQRQRGLEETPRIRRQGGGGEGVTGPVHTYVKTDEHAHFKWGVRHHVGHEYAGRR